MLKFDDVRRSPGFYEIYREGENGPKDPDWLLEVEGTGLCWWVAHRRAKNYYGGEETHEMGARHSSFGGESLSYRFVRLGHAGSGDKRLLLALERPKC